MRDSTRAAVCAAAMVIFACSASRALAQGRPTALAATRANASELRALDQQIDQMIRARDLRVRETVRDTMLADRIHDRLDQYLRGVRIEGGDVTRQSAADGTVSVFGTLHTGVDLDVTPRLAASEARSLVAKAAGGDAIGADPELVVLPLPDGYHLAYHGQATTTVDIVNVYIDANTGASLRQFSEFTTEGAVGKGKGVFGDDKKVSATPASGGFVTEDTLRPTDITTYDMKGNFTRTLSILNRLTTVAAADVASDADNDWTDGAVVDAHAYAGWYYDYLFKRFSRSGIDNANLRIAVFTHPVRLADINTAAPDVVGMYYANAFNCNTCGPNGRGAVVFGEGAPRGFFGNFEVKPFSGAIDVVAHELTHAVTGVTARLNGFPFSEAGALNEGFSDIFGSSASFFLQPQGAAPLSSGYLLGRDLTVPGGAFARSLSNPASTGDPDHYSLRFIGGDSHYNSVIVSHAFYLAIEGGTNRTSGRSVQGVGATNREQIEKSFFRALTSLLPSSATFALTRVATIQSARDLYGVGSPAERAITQAWDAVGVVERTAPTAALLPNPTLGSAAVCGSVTPSWTFGMTVSAGATNLQVNSWTMEVFDQSGRSVDRETFSPADFAGFFSSCGPGSSRILAQNDACTTLCLGLAGFAGGTIQGTFNVSDANGAQAVTTSRVTLAPVR